MGFKAEIEKNRDRRVMSSLDRYILLDDSKSGANPGISAAIFDTQTGQIVWEKAGVDSHNATIAPGKNGNIWLYGTTGNPVTGYALDTGVEYLPFAAKPPAAPADEILEVVKEIRDAVQAIDERLAVEGGLI